MKIYPKFENMFNPINKKISYSLIVLVIIYDIRDNLIRAIGMYHSGNKINRLCSTDRAFTISIDHLLDLVSIAS